MSTPPRIGPLAQLALADLAMILQSPRAGHGIEVWIRVHARRARRRELQIVLALAVAVGDRRAQANEAPASGVWRPEADAASPSATLLGERLVAACLNDDAATASALAAAWARWEPEARGEVLRVLIRLLAPR
ncbi:hypothetical protein [Microbacterium oleivorans]|uniref:Uncharacterized protein n=1 Tax=Microbacterium oleivorans TaxID=273677 RepID=A0A7D5IWK7_9MICO|nr:hypothetical protein [Microbacterium oleivorans]QLD12102.1 hypothetical protein HW566_10195 [Microbacterium oleivorans]